MLPANYSTLSSGFLTPEAAVKKYFDRQYPNTANCSQLENQVRNIQRDITQLNMVWVHSGFQGLSYLQACKKIWPEKLELKQRQLANCTVTAAIVNPQIYQPTNVGLLSNTNLPETLPGANVNSNSPPAQPSSTVPAVTVDSLTNQSQVPVTEPIATETSSTTATVNTALLSTKNKNLFLIGIGATIVVTVILLLTRNKK